MKIIIKVAFFTLVLQLTGCDGSEKNITESQMKKIRIVAKLPDEIEILPVGIMYRSILCPKITFNGKGGDKSTGLSLYNVCLSEV